MSRSRNNQGRRGFLKTAGVLALGAGVPSLAFGGSSLSEIRERGYLLYGFNGERPYNFLESDGKLVGSEIDIARAVCERMGIPEVQGVAMNFDSFIPAIQAGRIDTCLPIFVKPPRCKILTYATPHLKEGQACVVVEGNPKGIGGWDDLVNKDVKVGLVAGTTPNEIAQNAGVPDSRITRFPDTTTLTAGMKSGRVDAIVEASGTIRGLFGELEGQGFERVVGWTKPSNTSGKIEFLAGFPFNQGNGQLRDAFDAELVSMLADGSINDITAPYGISAADRPGPNDPTLAEECAG